MSNIHLPDIFKFYIGGYSTGYTEISWNGEQLVVGCHTFSPTSHEWEQFWKTLDKLNVWDWEEEYANLKIMDGTNWCLHIKKGDKEVRSTGANA